jgi:hypothetical protein
MKLLKSNCGNAWLFDCRLSDGWIEAGLACFLPWCSGTVTFEIKEKEYIASVSSRAVDKAGAVRIMNARLPLLD